MGKHIVPGRLLRSLQEVASVSEQHALFVCQVLIEQLPVVLSLPRDAHILLQLLLDLLVQLGLSLPGHIKEILNQQEGRTKKANLAKQLVAVCPENSTADYANALLQQVQSRLEQAKSWSLAQTE